MKILKTTKLLSYQKTYDCFIVAVTFLKNVGVFKVNNIYFKRPFFMLYFIAWGIIKNMCLWFVLLEKKMFNILLLQTLNIKFTRIVVFEKYYLVAYQIRGVLRPWYYFRL